MGYSLSHRLASFLIFFGFLNYTSINGNTIQSPNNTSCPSIDCDSGLKISYPFWNQSQQFDQQYCGYPGFNLSCNDHQSLMLHLSNSDDDDINYPIKEINYSNKSLILGYPLSSLNEASCPKLTHDFTFNTTVFSLFNSSSGNIFVQFFYNCSLYPPSLSHIECLKYGAKRSFVFKEGAIPEFDWHRYCESTVTVPVIDNKAVNGDSVQGFVQALRDGFKLSWKQRDGVCQLCEASGGFCSYSNGGSNNFFCICKNGRNFINCHSNDTYSGKAAAFSIGQEPNYVGIGALLFGSLVTIATVFYFFQKKKIGSHKPV